MNGVTLYAKTVHGHMRIWSIDQIATNLIEYTYGIMHGSMQRKTERVFLNESGRDMREQVDLRMCSRIGKMRDRGYCDTLEQAANRTNTLNLPRPMLAQSIDKAKNFNIDGAHIQRKYDGNRCLIANIAGEILAYTRNGKVIKTIDHITENMVIPEGAILDGELYCHGQKLQTIVSWIKRKQGNTKRLCYQAYDVISDLSFAERFATLFDMHLGDATEIAPTYEVVSMAAARDRFQLYRSEGYEGAILRMDGVPYEDGKRSKSLLKMKEWHDAEFRVDGVEPSKDGWGILVMKTPEGKVFRATAPGTVEAKEAVLINRDLYIDRYVTIEYAYLTKDGVPFHPVAKCWID